MATMKMLAMITPSVKLWNESPKMIIHPVRPWSWPLRRRGRHGDGQALALGRVPEVLLDAGAGVLPELLIGEAAEIERLGSVGRGHVVALQNAGHQPHGRVELARGEGGGAAAQGPLLGLSRGQDTKAPNDKQRAQQEQTPAGALA